MKNVFVAGGGVGLNSLISGEIQNLAGAAVMSTANAGTEYQVIKLDPSGQTGAGSASTTWANSNVTLGETGAAGDYIEGLEISNSDALNAAVFLEDGALAAVVGVNSVSGTGGTNPTAISTFSLTPTAAITAAINLYAGYILSVTYTITNGPSKTILRKIVSHPVWSATSGAGSLVFTVSHVVPAGATITAWKVIPTESAYEVQPFNTPAGSRYIPMGRRSVNGGWMLSVDATAQVVASGLFL
jgi:hypothetical protein